MNLEGGICCLCLHLLNQKSYNLLEHGTTNLSYYEKITTSFPQLVFSEKCQDYKICALCCTTIDTVYNFSKTCLQSLNIFTEYRKKPCSINKNGKDLIVTTQDNENRMVEDHAQMEADPLSSIKSEPDNENNHYGVNIHCETVMEEIDIKEERFSNEDENSGKTSFIQDKTDDNKLQYQLAGSSTNPIETVYLSDENVPTREKTIIIYTSKKYVCDICNKHLSCKTNLNRHKRTHTGVKPFTCDVCSKSFIRSSELNQHKYVHTGDKPFVCELCNKGFTFSSNLSQHMRIHTNNRPHACDICNKGFTNTSALKKHKRCHGEIRPYVCEICQKGFKHSNNLKTHKRVHDSENGFLCNFCNVGFIHYSDLLAHLHIHAGEKRLKVK